MKLALGTAQVGLSYGVANKCGKVVDEDLRAIIDIARAGGIDTIDTAMSYGDAESRLGKLATDGFSIITKLPDVPAATEDARHWVVECVRAALVRLRRDKLAGLLLHRPASLLGPHGKGIVEGLREVVTLGWVVKSGVSVYAPDQLSSLPQEFKPAIVQIPFNLFDQRILADGWLARMHDSGVEVHLRSVFLQGLLLMAPTERPQWTEKWNREFSALDQWLRQSRQSPLEACIGAAMSLPSIGRIVIGVDSSSHLTDLLRVASLPQKEIPVALAATDSNLLNPSNWPVGPF